MRKDSKGPESFGLRVLTETDIQDRLYGAYLGKPRKGAHDSPWTGEEILLGELSQLRQELTALRKQREELMAQLSQRNEGSALPPSPRSHRGSFLGRFLGLLLIVGGIGYPLGIRLLQASPMSGETSPYTIQVAVYDVRIMAERFVALLRELGYPAFLMEVSRRSGRPRYRIYVGRFVTKGEAELERTRLTSDPRFSDAFVRVGFP